LTNRRRSSSQAAGICEACAGTICRVDLGSQLARRPDVVVVEKDHPCPARRLDPRVSRPRETLRPLVIHPQVRTGFFTPRGERADFFLYVGRFVSYKRPDLAVETFRRLPEHRLLMVGDGPLAPTLRAKATSNVSFLGTVDDDRLRELYRAANALVYPAEEDFGIAMAEAQAYGTPVIGLAAGGAIDIVEPGRTGWLLPDQSVDALCAAVGQAAAEELDAEEIARRAQRFSAERFRREIREAAVECAVAA
jgi:glycosyltransferase involved in cell wall biosynthesis